MIIAIDGPAGAGKSTIARKVATKLGFQLVDTGAIYRAVAFEARRRHVELEDAEALAAIARGLDFHFEIRDEENLVFCNGEQLGDEIRTPENSVAASIVSAHPRVRDALLDVQRRVGRDRDSVLEGRDIGTVVFPDADAKVFLTAAPEVRARRRVDQLVESGAAIDYDQTLREIRERDERDTTRTAAPLVKARDAVEIDSTAHSIDEVVQFILDAVAAAR